MERNKNEEPVFQYNVGKDLRHDNSIKIQSIIILVVILCSIFSAIYFYLQLSSEQKKLEESTVSLEETNKSLVVVQDSLQDVIGQLQTVRDSAAKLTAEVYNIYKKPELLKLQELLQFEQNIKFEVEASSYLEESKIGNYLPQNIVDKNLNTPWVEGGEGYGIGEYLVFKFNKAVNTGGIVIYNGYNLKKNDGIGDRYIRNGRLKTTILEFSDGTKKTIELKDIREPQQILFEKKKTDFVKLIIKEAYLGEGYRSEKWEDTSISEIRFVYLPW
ncbi:MAG: hypothetical protein AAF806_20875 [Bacteroidota bacterium]